MAVAGVSALARAGVMVVARHQARQDALWTLLPVQNVVPTLVLGSAMGWLWEPMRLSDVPVLLPMGGFATIGMASIARAYSHVEASRAASLEHTGRVRAALPDGWRSGRCPPDGASARRR
ncbi:MAG: hypothetical protein O9345_07920 [Burkholderiaceae bacterium]|jgi:hypothetical protein|nr:hypothetical protein [Burkholderiales bacterium]MCZ8338067.1 hypothetical protein [Burkholderiaceae bacterium]